MTPETVNTIKEALAPIAAKIGQGAEYGWEVVVRQQYISGITSFVVAGMMLIVAAIGGYVLHQGIKHGVSNNWYGGAEIPMIIGGILAISIGLVLSGVSLVDGIQHMLNPAYYALDFFIHLGSSTN